MYNPPLIRSTTYMIPFFVYMNVVDTIGLGSRRNLRHEVSNFLGLEGIGCVEHPDACVKPGFPRSNQLSWK